MVPSQQQPQPVAASSDSGAGRRGLAWASLLLALVLPLTYLVIGGAALASHPTPHDTIPLVASLFIVFDYFVWPCPILAVILGHIALARGGPSRPAALGGLALGYLCILVLLGTIVTLILSLR